MVIIVFSQISIFSLFLTSSNSVNMGRQDIHKYIDPLLYLFRFGAISLSFDSKVELLFIELSDIVSIGFIYLYLHNSSAKTGGFIILIVIIPSF